MLDEISKNSNTNRFGNQIKILNSYNRNVAITKNQIMIKKTRTNQRFMRYSLLLILLILINSCDGKIIDSETKKALNEVAIEELNKDFINYSDQNGVFEIHHITSFALSDNDLTIIISKDKYKTDTITIKNRTDKLIEMIQIK
ncbi:hypothetical protein ACFPVY_02675 [Flavobacterium qiangtangense]|uniref:Uncharacterized protein n=1 Tax=Flavobacterium qiangtangense TaxID=1442595 RepID=A0ABW1PL17_9FLAO